MVRDNVSELTNLVKSHHPLVFVTTAEEGRLEGILARVAEQLAIPFLHWTCTTGMKRWQQDDPVNDTEDPVKALDYAARCPVDTIFLFKDLHSFLDKPVVLRKLRDTSRQFERSRRVVVVSGPGAVVPPELEKTAARYEVVLPTESELRELARQVYLRFQRSSKVVIDLTHEQFDALIRAMRGMTLEEAERALSDAILRDLRLDASDREIILARKKEAVERGGVLEFSHETESLADVGGLENLKAWLAKRRGAFSDEARKFGLPWPKGILLLGVPGCGKSLCAKAVASDWTLPLLRFDPGRLYHSFVGETERHLRNALAMAEYVAPVVLWIDEIEKGFSYSSSSESDAGLSRRVFGTFLAWLQDKKAPVFVVATCNSIDQLPPELLRKGRFDETFFVDLPSPAERRQVLTIHLKRRGRDPATHDLEALAAATESFSGAEIEQVIVSGLYSAFSAKGELTTEVLLREIASTVPLAVSMAERIDDLRAWARSRAVPASRTP